MKPRWRVNYQLGMVICYTVCNRQDDEERLTQLICVREMPEGPSEFRPNSTDLNVVLHLGGSKWVEKKNGCSLSIGTRQPNGNVLMKIVIE
jgi:hypothetical protein